jgi:CBS domain-containing protein
MMEKLCAGAICTRNVATAYRGMPLNQAARLMREHHVGTLVVADEDERGKVAVGILTDRDIVTGVVAKDADPRFISVGDLMSVDLVTAREEDSVIDVLRTMRLRGVRRIPVTDAVGALVGLVALDDVLDVISRQLRLMVDAIQSERKREPAQRP